MAMKTPEATIDFLLTCIDSIEGKVDWEAVATKTGWYKAGNKQAFGSIHKKYAGTVIGVPAGGVDDVGVAKIKTPKKRAAGKISDEDGEAGDDAKSSSKKRAAVVNGELRKAKKAKTEKVTNDDKQEVKEDAGSGEA